LKNLLPRKYDDLQGIAQFPVSPTFAAGFKTSIKLGNWHLLQQFPISDSVELGTRSVTGGSFENYAGHIFNTEFF